jgi:hypothetical protein
LFIMMLSRKIIVRKTTLQTTKNFFILFLIFNFICIVDVFETVILRRIFEIRRDENAEWRELHNEEFIISIFRLIFVRTRR